MPTSYITIRIHNHPSLFNLMDFRHGITNGDPYTHRLVGSEAQEALLYYETDDIDHFTSNIATVFEENKFSFEMTVHKQGDLLPEPFLRGKSPKIA